MKVNNLYILIKQKLSKINHRRNYFKHNIGSPQYFFPVVKLKKPLQINEMALG